MEAKSDAFGTDALETEIDAVAAAQEDRTGSGKHFDLSDAAPSPSKSPSGVKTLSLYIHVASASHRPADKTTASTQLRR